MIQPKTTVITFFKLTVAAGFSIFHWQAKDSGPTSPSEPADSCYLET
jgi:hypothetical protein